MGAPPACIQGTSSSNTGDWHANTLERTMSLLQMADARLKEYADRRKQKAEGQAESQDGTESQLSAQTSGVSLMAEGPAFA